jgi:hypothetical protein
MNFKVVVWGVVGPSFDDFGGEPPQYAKWGGARLKEFRDNQEGPNGLV